MKTTLMFLIICFLAMGSFLIGIGCKGQQQSESESVQQQPKPKSVQQQSESESALQQPEPASAQQQTLDMHDMRLSADSEKEPLEALDDNYLSPSESIQWLERRGYSISREGSRYILTKGGVKRAEFGNVGGTFMLPPPDDKFLIKTDSSGIRVKPISSQR